VAPNLKATKPALDCAYALGLRRLVLLLLRLWAFPLGTLFRIGRFAVLWESDLVQPAEDKPALLREQRRSLRRPCVGREERERVGGRGPRARRDGGMGPRKANLAGGGLAAGRGNLAALARVAPSSLGGSGRVGGPLALVFVAVTNSLATATCPKIRGNDVLEALWSVSSSWRPIPREEYLGKQ
jgi:hypothetical protein